MSAIPEISWTFHAACELIQDTRSPTVDRMVS